MPADAPTEELDGKAGKRPEPVIPKALDDDEPDRGARARAFGTTTLRTLRTVAIIGFIVAGLVALGVFLIHRYPRTSHTSATYSGVQRVTIALEGGATVNVHGGTGDEVLVHTTDRANLFDPPQRQNDVVGGGLFIVGRCKNTNCHMAYDVTVPMDTQIDIELDHSVSSQDSISVSDLDAPVNLFTSLGNVSLTRLSGTVQVVASGDVTGTGLSGKTIDVYSPIAKHVKLAVAQAPDRLHVTTALPGTVDLTVPPGNYRVDAPTGTYRLDEPGTAPGVTVDPNAAPLIQLSIDPSTSATIHAS